MNRPIKTCIDFAQPTTGRIHNFIVSTFARSYSIGYIKAAMSEERIWANVNSDSEEEVSESANSDELLAVGNSERREHESAVTDTENETSAIGGTEDSSASCEGGRHKKCSCGSTRQARLRLRALWCKGCGGEINRSPVNLTSSSGKNAAIIVVTSSYPSHPALPSTSLEQNTAELDGGSPSLHQHAASFVTGRSRGEKTPVQNVCKHSFQSPSPGMEVIMFLFERTHRERNEKCYTLFIIPEREFQVYEAILRSFADEGNVTFSQPGYSTRQIQFTVDGQSQDFHTEYVQEQIKVSFEIQSGLQENFAAHNEGHEFVFSIPFIHCQSQNRLAPGAKSEFRVEYRGGPGKRCQEHGKIRLIIDSEIQHTLFFSISIWVPD